MKRILIILIWITYFSGSKDDLSPYEIIQLEENVRALIPRENYLEYIEFMQINESNIDHVKKVDAYYQWEYIDKFKEFVHNAL